VRAVRRRRGLLTNLSQVITEPAFKMPRTAAVTCSDVWAILGLNQ
jgi:hypothetical protein